MSYTKKRHDRGVSRKNAYKAIQRKKRILESYGEGVLEEFTDGQIHRLAKNKLHCSCPMCQEKTRTLGWKHSDKVKIERCNYVE